jgi:CBS domain containing-hemolysin-like protein
MPISEINDILYAKFPVEEAHSIGGLIVTRLRNIPKEGDTIEEQGYKITVIEADNRSVIKVKMERL